MPFQIKYKFKDDKDYYICCVTWDQYKNFKKLPIVKECEVVQDDAQNKVDFYEEMQEALRLLAKNDTSHITKII